MVSNKFINECKKRANANRLGKIKVDNDIEITNSDKLQSFNIDSGCCVDGKVIGSVYVKCLKANFLDTLNVNLVDKTIKAQIGVKYADNTMEYINMGKYIVERPNDEITANMSQITAYDKLYDKLDKPYICGIDYSAGNKTLKDLYIDVCFNLGLTSKTTDILNGDIPIIDNPFKNGEKNRTVLKTVSTVACSYVEIDNDIDQIDLCWLSNSADPDYTFEKNDYVSVEGGDIVYGPLNTVIIKNSQIDDENVTQKDDESIAINGEHSIVISEDYILYNAELRRLAMPAIFNRLNGLKYTNCKLTTSYGKPFLKNGAKIRVKIDENKYFDTYSLKHKFSYDGSFESIIESPVLTEQEIKTKQDISLGQQLLNTEIEINKQKQEIKGIVSTQTEHSSQISQLQMDTKNIELSVSKVESDLDKLNVTEDVQGQELILANSAGENLINFQIDGKTEQVAIPSPDAPSELKSIADIVNKFKIDKDNIVSGNNFIKEIKDRNNFTLYDDGKTGGWKTIKIRQQLKKNTDYTIQFTQVNTNTAMNNWLAIDKIVEGSSTNISNGGYTSGNCVNFNTSDADYIDVLFYVQTGAGQVAENIATIKDVKIYEGTYNKDIIPEYVPYGNILQITSYGKNLINPVRGTQTNGGVTLTNNGDSSFTISGTSEKALSIPLTDLIEFPIKLKANRTYTQSITILSGSLGNYAIVPSVKDADDNVTYNYFRNNQTKTTDKEYRIHQYNIYVGNADQVVNCTFKVQLEESPVATAWEDYRENTTNLDLKQSLKSIHDIHDEFKIENGQASIVKRIGFKTLDGTEEFYKNTNYSTDEMLVVQMRVDDMKPATDNLLCSHFKYNKPSIVNSFRSADIYLLLCVDTNELSTVEQFKQWLSENNVTVYYELAEEEIIPMEDVFIPTLNADSKIKSTDPLQSDMSCTYIKDTKFNDVYQNKDNMKDYYTKSETDAKISVSADNIKQTVSDVQTTLYNDYYKKDQVDAISNTNTENIATMQSQISTLQQLANQFSINFTNISQNGVNKIVTETGYTFDKNGLSISKTGEAFNVLITNEGFYTKRDNEVVLKADPTGVETENLTVRTYFIKANKTREEFCEDDMLGEGIAEYWVGD